MGRLFNDEIEGLEETYHWAREVSVTRFSERIASLASRPMFAVGSGGSLTTAEIATALFHEFDHGFSSALTPLELASRRGVLRSSSVFLASAAGSNPDIIGALRIAAENEAEQVLALCTSLNSRIAQEADKYSNVEVEAFEVPADRDGFLATRSLFVSAILLARAFCESNGVSPRLPAGLSTLVGRQRWQNFVDSVVQRSTPLWARETLIVLYGPSARPAAVDLESKLTEAALSNCWVADYRNFAHGRHHWLAKKGAASSILAFISPSNRSLAEKTLALIPSEIPRLRVDIPDGPYAILTSLAHVFPVILSAGQARGIDPGRPGVPSFGRCIYHINAFPRNSTHSSLEVVAIERKTTRSVAQLERSGELEVWLRAYYRALARIRKGRYSAIVFDYDGTLCGSEERFTGLNDAVSRHLRELLTAGLSLGVATGRGKSVRAALRAALPEKHWPNVSVGYYNGGQVASLDDDAWPDGRPVASVELQPAVEALVNSKRLGQVASIEKRLHQITVSATSVRDVAECWSLLTHALFSRCVTEFKLVRSTHSFDVLPNSVSKLAVVRTLARNDKATAVLTIGDMGQWPGNDYELLTHVNSLSVDEVSPDPNTCWNLASPGIRGVEATLEYLSKIKVSGEGMMRLGLHHRAASTEK